ncbi:MAG: penicillin-binding protein, partial [Erysipelotrichaceae bacterium]|nr:penicillin-binding protein [Erysipelotrichaceae bacterium]
MKKRSNNMLLFIFITTLVVMAVLIANVFFVSVMKVHLRSDTDLSVYADSANQVTKVLGASRGTIYDANGVVIAQDVHTYDIICILDKNRPAIEGTVAYVADPVYTASILAPILKMPEDLCLKFLQTEGQYQVELGTYGRNLSK